MVSISIDTERTVAGADEAVFRYLELFDRENIRATFFVVGRVAEDRPDIVDAIVAAGHEVGSHGWDHPNIGDLPEDRPPFTNQLNDDALAEQLARCREVLTRGGVAPKGFRAPWFRINAQNLTVIARYFQYDSSLTTAMAATMPLPPGLRELPVSCLGNNGPRLGMPFLFGPGALQGTLAWLRFTPKEPLVLYGHSLDLMDLSGIPLRTSRLKRIWYYNRCGPQRGQDIATLIRVLRARGYLFGRCQDMLPTAVAA